jgi:acyl-CoA dehydrogenase
MMQFEFTPEQKQLKETARRFAADEIIPVAARYDEEQTFPEGVVRKAWERAPARSSGSSLPGTS